LFFGRYMDRLERRDGEWRIALRRYLLHGQSSEPYAEASALAQMVKADGLGPGHPLYSFARHGRAAPALNQEAP
jgi:hypothetical protein